MKNRLTCCLTLLFLWSLVVEAQSISDTVKIGGQYKQDTPYQEAPQRIKLEEAQIAVTYQFKYATGNDKPTLFLTDTMSLVIGAQYSIYFDRNDKNRHNAFASYLKNKSNPPKVFLNIPINELTEIAVNEDNSFTPSLSGETAQLYKDRKRNIITIMDFDTSNFDENELLFFHEEATPPINWKIKEDTLSVLGYTCTKATCNFGGRNYTAWFTQDIPMPEGPYKFYGLPGLILKIEDSESLFQFKAVGLEKLKNTEIVMDDKSKYLSCTKEEYNTLKKRMKENYSVFYRKDDILNYSYKKNDIKYLPIEKSDEK